MVGQPNFLAILHLSIIIIIIIIITHLAVFYPQLTNILSNLGLPLNLANDHLVTLHLRVGQFTLKNFPTLETF